MELLKPDFALWFISIVWRITVTNKVILKEVFGTLIRENHSKQARQAMYKLAPKLFV